MATQDEIEKIDAALSSVTRMVKYGERTIENFSVDELNSRKNELLKKLYAQSGGRARAFKLRHGGKGF